MSGPIDPADGDYSAITPEMRAALLALCTEYLWRVDHGHSASIATLFTKDGQWAAPGILWTGQAALVDGWQRHQVQNSERFARHMMASARFALHKGGIVSGIVGFTVYAGARDNITPPAPVLVGEHHDCYVQQDDGAWRFQSRRVVPLFPSNWRPRGV